MLLLLSILIFFAAPIFVSCLLIRKSNNFSFLLSFSFFIVFQQILFLLFASLIKSFFISFILSALVIIFINFYFLSIQKNLLPQNLSKNQKINLHLLPLFVFALFLLTYIFIRSYYPFVAFINNGQEVGVEKLYNLSLHQSFLFGSSWPTEWIWLAGEPIKYYVFLKSIPGLISYLARVLFNDPATGGYLFVLSEAFYFSLVPGLIVAWLLFFKYKFQSKFSNLFIVLIGSIAILGTHWKAISIGFNNLIFNTPIDWWQLADQVVPFTQSQYPVWLMLLGDNHAYSQVYFLQVLLFGSVFWLALQDKYQLLLSAATGIIASAVLLSHPGSVLVGVSTLVPFGLMAVVYCFCQKDFGYLKNIILNFITSAFIAGIFALLLYQPAGDVKLVIPPAKLASSFLGLINQNIIIVSVSFVLFTLFGFSKLKDKKLTYPVLLASILCAITYFSDRQIFAFYGLIFLIISLIFRPYDSKTNLAYLFICTTLLILIPSEIIAFDHTLDSRVDWIRFQMTLRFWPESYILIPFSFGIGIVAFGDNYFSSEKKIKLLNFILSISLLIICISHYPGIKNRVSRSTQDRTIDGFNEFYRRYPSDAAIVKYLRQTDETDVIIGELCSVYGYPNIPEHFGWPGRIAAYSGRTGICGWGRHAALYNNPLTQVGFKKTRVEDKLQGYTAVYQRFLRGESSLNSSINNLDKVALRTYGVKFLILGEWEKNLFPSVNIEKLSTEVNGTVVLKNADGTGIIKLN